MPLFHRPGRLPAALVARLDLPRHDSVLAAAALADDRWAVDTRQALYVLGDSTVQRIAWAQIDHGILDPAKGTLDVRLVTGATVLLPLVTAATSRPFATVFRERVQSSVVYVTTTNVPAAGEVRVAVRRAGDGSLFTQTLGPAGVDLTEPQVAALVEDAERRACEAVGLRFAPVTPRVGAPAVDC